MEIKTVMAMTAPILAHDPEYYESPEEWRPERFLEDPNIEKNLLTWSRGERVCLGVSNLQSSHLQAVSVTFIFESEHFSC